MHAKKKNMSGKLLALLVALMLLVGGTVGGTLAWLFAQTAPIVNTFTAGDINIELSEPNFDNKVAAKVLPGDKIAKDPTVTVEAGSEDCYVRMFMMVDWSDEADDHFIGTESVQWYNFSSDWNLKNGYIDETANVVRGHVFEYRYKDVVPYSEGNTVLPALFTEITVPEDITGEQYQSLEGSSITVIAQAVQSLGSNSADEAFNKAGIPAVVQAAIDRYMNVVPPTT